MTQITKHITVGLPASGKTTYLAALWHVVESGDIPGALRLAETHGDQAYLNRIAARWGRGFDIGRTSRESETVVSMRLVDADDSVAEVHFPDLAGESFSDQWTYRRCHRNYFDHAANASGVLLFVHPDGIRDAVALEERDLTDDDVQTVVPSSDSATGAAERHSEFREWEPRLAPTAVQLVELVQFLGRPPFNIERIRVAVVVSAWDLVWQSKQRSEGLNPDDWCARRLPLLHQFLASNQEQFPSRIYGISAQGGELGDPSVLERPASQRIIVEGGGSAPHDITAPIKWLMGSEK